jgi:hypothetical protein
MNRKWCEISGCDLIWGTILRFEALEWSRSLRHELSSPHTGVVGSNATRGMDVCVCLSCVYVAALWRVDPPFKESHRMCIRLRNWKSGKTVLLIIIKTKNSVALVRERTIPTEWPHLSAKLVPNFPDRGVSRSQRGGSLAAVLSIF